MSRLDVWPKAHKLHVAGALAVSLQEQLGGECGFHPRGSSLWLSCGQLALGKSGPVVRPLVETLCGGDTEAGPSLQLASRSLQFWLMTDHFPMRDPELKVPRFLTRRNYKPQPLRLGAEGNCYRAIDIEYCPVAS